VSEGQAVDDAGVDERRALDEQQSRQRAAGRQNRSKQSQHSDKPISLIFNGGT